jgi:outer membrane protein insertion porin family
MQKANRAWLRAALCLPCVFGMLSVAGVAAAQSPPTVTEIRVEQEGRVITDPSITSLIENGIGQPLSMRDVRESITHLTSLDRYDDVQVFRDDVATGVRVRYVLVPAHPVDRLEFRGMLGLPEDDLRRVVRDQFGLIPPATRMTAVVEALREAYTSRGYPQAMINAHIDPTHNPDRATMVFDVTAGTRVTIARVTVDQADPTPKDVVVGAPDVRVGQPYDAERIDKEIEDYAAALRRRGYLQASATRMATFTPAGADVILQVSRGPKVVVAFTGDSIPSSERTRLVPIESEASVSQDLLEDSQNAIVDYFRGRGYRDATVALGRDEQPGLLTLTFDVKRGPRYTIDEVAITGGTTFSQMELADTLRVKKGEPYVEAALNAGVLSIRNLYRNAGYTRASIMPVITELPQDQGQDTERRVAVALPVVEGPRTLIRTITFEGVRTVPEADLRRLLKIASGQPYSEPGIVADRDRVDTEYLDRGYTTVSVVPTAMFSADGTQADVFFTISEGPQVFVDHIIISGNTRTSASTIQREVTLKVGQPMAYSAIIETQQRLSALGLFRQVRVTEVPHEGDPRHDVLVKVTESEPNTIVVAPGLEVGSRLRSSDTGTAEERYEFVPRGSIEVGRRNLWGKNRSINGFARAALRSRDLVLNSGGISLEEQAGGLAFNEFRTFATYREPKVFNTGADLLVTAIIDQAVRSSFNFNRKETRVEVGGRLSDILSVAGRYSFERTRLFDEQFSEDEKPLIDRLFPQVRLSKLSATVLSGTQNLIDPVGGGSLSVTTDVALRAIGSEVGFAKMYVEGYAYPQVPFGPRTILAMGARLGAAHGFPRDVGGEIVQDIPVSERFFAGGDTSVRGFSIDRLGDADTITPAGFPTGGSAIAVFNSELRFKIRTDWQGVTFVDVGNVFARTADLSLADLRPTAGFGVRVKAPLLNAPLRVDLGFNLDRRELTPGHLEKGYVVHVSLGQAF